MRFKNCLIHLLK